MNRTAAHYRKMLADNPSASVGTTLAARMVYAARHGNADKPDERLKDISRDLMRRYGGQLSPADVRREMDLAVTPVVSRQVWECACTRCGHIWIARVEWPRTCASCRSPYWNRPRRS